MKDSMDGRWRDVMTVVSGRGAHVPMLVVKVLMLHVLMLDVIMLMLMMKVVKVMKVKGLVTVKVLLEVKEVVKVFEVVVKEEVLFLLFSLSSTTTTRTSPSTRPAGRVWASGAKGLGFQFAAPAPGRRCSGPFS